jgi:hypothetical protein
MSQPRKGKTKTRRAANDLMHGLRELARALETGLPLSERFTVRNVRIADPGKR